MLIFEQKLTGKFLTQRMQDQLPGIPSIQGVVFVIDAHSGELLSLMDGAYIIALRTGASSDVRVSTLKRIIETGLGGKLHIHVDL